MTTCTIFPGERGIDCSFHYPTGASIRAKGYTFAVGYISPNPKKNIPLAVILDWIACGLGVWLVWEVNSGQTNHGRTQGQLDGQIASRQATILTCPQEVAVIAANDTDTTSANIILQEGYMEGFYNAEVPYPFGGYMDTDLGARVNQWPYTRLLWLPNAYRWDVPAPYPKTVAIQKAKDLGYHMIQGRLTDDVHDPSYDVIDGINVDINHCIAPCTAWGNPREEPPMTITPYLFKLASGDVGLRHESGSRGVNLGEVEGPFKGEVVYDIPADSYWEHWIKLELAKYANDLALSAPAPQPAPVPLRVTLEGTIQP